MKKIISLVLVMMIAMTTLFAESIPLEENPRIIYKGYTIYKDIFEGESKKRLDQLIPFTANYIQVDFISAYSDTTYKIEENYPILDASISTDGKSIYYYIMPTFEEFTPVRINFYRVSDSSTIYYKDIEIPCGLPNDQSSLYADKLMFYSGDPFFGAIANDIVLLKIPNEIMDKYDGFESYAVVDENGKLVNYDTRKNGRNPLHIMNEEQSGPGKYYFYGYINNRGNWITVTSEFEVFE